VLTHVSQTRGSSVCFRRTLSESRRIADAR
jgi:hypothetical protein